MKGETMSMDEHTHQVPMERHTHFAPPGAWERMTSDELVGSYPRPNLKPPQFVLWLWPSLVLIAVLALGLASGVLFLIPKE